MTETTLQGFLSFVGGCCVFVFALTGAMLWMRYGWVGVVMVFRARHVLDGAVRTEIEDVISIGERRNYGNSN